MDWLAEYGMFAAKALTVLLALVCLLLVIASLKGRQRKGEGALTVTRLNDQLARMTERLGEAVLDKPALKALQKTRKQERKARDKGTAERNKVFVLNFHGDIRASALENLRHEVTAVLELATPQDEVVVKLESGGGMVHSYGLAAAQLTRLREAGVPLTVCVDKVAASGGYMMACVADRILVAPFAMLGSIGVVAQLPNFHRVLKNHDVDYEMLTAGEYKRTLTMFGENTDKGREKFQEDLENIHRLFKQFVERYRPSLNVDAVATGEVWFGVETLERALADEVNTSDDYINRRIRQADVFEVHFARPKRLQDRLSSSMSAALDRVLLTWASRFYNQRFW
ncbi:inner membrane peptidase. Serine peptidase. MEROPS family S49 [Halopseudomonas litoralis]|uniref:Inner membrane peptidase. Serine peptidase. MEROPS family S49 n=1 Tax=Halopseudomonas litoralis TaxID=797277 RepID=A0A1H1PM22_9GAMM|nr:protease SohB [Halopseudomonas litoralis]SDS12216.1 inner membrane peptidase. Serine peptidase. MEROPS family S49 [Halopseudomonas litoralis]